MAKIYTSVDQLIGRTPMLELVNTQKEYGLGAKIYAKLEYFNPAGSVKDRVAKQMLDDAERDGRLTKDSVIIEPTSGNTGIGLAAVAAARGYKAIIVMPDTMSAERRKLMTAYGAELVLTDGKKGMAGAIERANELLSELDHGFIAGQFENPSNPKAHFTSTGPEIWDDTEGMVDIFVAGIGTGGTISGVGEYLKMKNSNVKIVGVEPSGSAILTGGKAGPHGIQGIGAGFVPKTLDLEVCDEIVAVSEESCYEASRMMGKTEGVLVGISSGAALSVAIELAKRPENKGKNIVVLLPDGADRYLSTSLF